MTKARLGAAGWLAPLFVVAGCNPQNVAMEAGLRTDAGPIVVPVVVSQGGPVDLGCVGHATLPAGTGPVSGTLHIYEFLSMAPIGGNHVDIFSNNVITDACAAPDCTTYSTDSAGNVALTLTSADWFAYRLAASGQTAPVLAFNQPWLTATGELDVPGFAPGTISAVGMLFMRTFQSTTLGSMSGRVLDCAGHALANVRTRVFVGDHEVLNGALADQASPRITGLEGTAPTRTGLTGQSGNFVGANIPPTDDCHVEAWAVTNEGAAESLIGCEEAHVVVGGITLSIIAGLRSDYAPGSRCAIASGH